MSYEVLWRDIDANRHVNYAAYIEAATELRYRFFKDHHIPPEAFEEQHIGPTYTSLQINFFREVRLGETVTITFQMAGLSESGMRWRIRHEFLKANGKKAVTIQLEGTFLDLDTRRPTMPTPEILQAFQAAPRSDDFELLPEMRWFGRRSTTD
jgi:acyl-CoA thioester hydrolase